ncbi:MAG TPA: class II glutamine amidotransferase [Flavobacteriales bacterium]|nr:class II glutamine amidotransferase [Flavobacteriales bacterium]
MCRLVAYLGRPILMEKLLIEPKNSLINQSFNAKEIEEPLNGDGFGVGWYNHILSTVPATFKSITPAWNNQNLRSIAPVVKSTCFMAHVRAATVGVLGEVNCHPFQYKTLLMMHNGDAPEFPKLKRIIRRSLSDELYNWIDGQTDSEHLFALFIDKLNQRIEHETTTAEVMADALEAMVRELEEIKKSAGITDQAYLNMVVTDGERTVAMRYISKPEEEEPLSLYYSEGSRYECIDGACHMIPTEDENKSVMIVSEKLTDIASDWKHVPTNHMVLVYKDLSVKLRKIAL